MKIETIRDYQKIPDDCPECNHNLEEVYTRPEDRESFFDLIVVRCPECKLYFAYWIEESDNYSTAEPPEEGANPTDHSFPFEHSNPKRISKKCAVAYLKSSATVEDKNKELDLLIKEKLPQLYKAGLSLATINFAKNRVPSHLKGKKLTRKTAAKLLAGAIYVTANGTFTEGSSLWKNQGEGITEEKLAGIFGVTRKTVRKWARKMN